MADHPEKNKATDGYTPISPVGNSALVNWRLVFEHNLYMRKISLLISCWMLLLPLYAQQRQPSLLKIFSENIFPQRTVSSVNWMQNGRYTLPFGSGWQPGRGNN
jgi:hypothetical protein